VQKRNDCWWFGNTGKCHNFYIIMTFAAFFALTDSGFAIMLVWSGDTESVACGSGSDHASEIPIKEKWRNRYVVAHLVDHSCMMGSS
jgi:hypothetical protein